MGPVYVPVSDEARQVLSEYMGAVRQSANYEGRTIDDVLLMARFKSLKPKLEDITDVISDFATCVYAGELPNPAVLVVVAECFQRYLAGGGNISLDDAFGRKKIKGARDPLKKKITQDERFKHHFMMYQMIKDARENGKRLSTLGAAAQVKETLNLHKTAESLESEYIYDGKTALFDEIFQFMTDMIEVIDQRKACEGKEK